MAESARARQDVENQTASRTSARCGLCCGSVHRDVLPVKCTTGASLLELQSMRTAHGRREVSVYIAVLSMI